jgi:hypothetical protein
MILENYKKAIKWITMKIQRPTIQIVIDCATYHDLNFSLKVNLNRIKMNNGSSYSAYRQTKKIKDYLELHKL